MSHIHRKSNDSRSKNAKLLVLAYAGAKKARIREP